MKRLVLAALAITLLGTPAAMADSWGYHQSYGSYGYNDRDRDDYNRGDRDDYAYYQRYHHHRHHHHQRNWYGHGDNDRDDYRSHHDYYNRDRY